nr:MAG TPA: hypothetical protein [Caudoviricetes sp.]
MVTHNLLYRRTTENQRIKGNIILKSCYVFLVIFCYNLFVVGKMLTLPTTYHISI